MNRNPMHEARLALHPRCAAHCRTTGCPCRNPAMVNDRCRKRTSRRELAHIKKLDDCFGQFLVRITCAKCKAWREMQPEAIERSSRGTRSGSGAATSRSPTRTLACWPAPCVAAGQGSVTGKRGPACCRQGT
jgi:hypothetical protein